MSYDHTAIEARWQQYWKDHATFEAHVDRSKPKYYVLDMFPYPSGSGLHVGHPEGYTATDIVARYKRTVGTGVDDMTLNDAFVTELCRLFDGVEANEKDLEKLIDAVPGHFVDADGFQLGAYAAQSAIHAVVADRGVAPALFEQRTTADDPIRLQGKTEEDGHDLGLKVPGAERTLDDPARRADEELAEVKIGKLGHIACPHCR